MSLKNLISYFTFLLLLTSCQGQDADNNNQQGGVDGSGGNLAAWVDSSFDIWVKNDHKYFLRDMVHRLYLINQYSPEDFGQSQKLAARFLSSEESEMMKLIDQLQFYTAPGSCPSNNHPASDASVTPDGKICFSYPAFKNLPLENFVSKLLIISMHEISHLKGFNESEATEWQSQFEDKILQRKTILFFNENYRSYRDSLAKILSNIKMAFNLSIENKEELKADVCQLIAIARDRAIDLVAQGYYVPSYLNKKTEPSILQPLKTINCDVASNYDLNNKLETILKSISQLSAMLANHEVSLCTGQLCYNRDLDYISQNPNLLAYEWAAKKELLKNNPSFAKKDLSQLRCVLTDLSEKKDYEFTTNNKPVVSVQFDIGQIDKNLRTVYIGPRSIFENEDEKAASSYSVLLTGQPNIQILNSSDFYNSFLGAVATIVPGSSHRKVQLHFATMNAKNEDSVVQDEYTKSGFNKFYYMNDPYFFTIKEMPTVLKDKVRKRASPQGNIHKRTSC